MGQEDPRVQGVPPVPPERGREAPVPLADQRPPHKRPQTLHQRGQAGHQIHQPLGRDPPGVPLLNLGGWRELVPAGAGGQQAPHVQRFDLVVEEAAVAQPALGDHHRFGGAQGAPQQETPPRGRLQPAGGGGRSLPGAPQGHLWAELGRVAFPLGPEAFGFGEGALVLLQGGPQGPTVVAHGGGGGSWEKPGKREDF